MVFSYKISFINRKELEPEPHYVISAPAPGGNLKSAPRLRLHNKGENKEKN
jgi:hypothetical protein